MSFVTIEVPPEVAPSAPFVSALRRSHQDITPTGFYKDLRDFFKTFLQDMGLKHIRPFLDAIMQLKPANTGILLRDNGDAD